MEDNIIIFTGHELIQFNLVSQTIQSLDLGTMLSRVGEAQDIFQALDDATLGWMTIRQRFEAKSNYSNIPNTPSRLK